MNAREIIDKFGGQTALAGMIDKGQSTVAHWAKTGVIPARWQPKLLMLALNNGIPLTANDFVDLPPAPKADAPKSLSPVIQSLAKVAPEHIARPTDAPEAGSVIAFNSGSENIQFKFESDNQVIWATTKNIADLFEVDPTTILKHVQNIFKDGELEEVATTAKFAVVQFEGGREVTREVSHYNLDVILSVGYRVNAKKATKFRQWATQTLKAYLEQGYVINEKALRESPDKLNKLAAHIRALRSEEKVIYAKVRECFKICASDYEPNSQQVKSFFALLQDKFHHAVTGFTSSKLIMERANFMSENMGLQTIKGANPTLEDAKSGKNYLRPEELYRLHILSEQFLLFAEATALANKRMTMQSLHNQLDNLLRLNDYQVFEGYQDYIRDEAIRHATIELGYYKKRKKLETLEIEFDENALIDGEYDDLLMGN